MRYKIVQDEITNNHYAYAYSGWWIFKGWVGILSSGKENGDHPSTAFSKREAESYIKKHHERVVVRKGLVYSSEEYIFTPVESKA